MSARFGNKVRFLAVASIYVMLHLSVALAVTGFNLAELLARLSYLDSTWFQHLALNGYVALPDYQYDKTLMDPQYAFLPGWPLLLRCLVRVIPGAKWLPLAGALVSLALFFFVLGASSKPVSSDLSPKDREYVMLFALSPLATAVFAFNPGAWIFFSNHTEALFLCTSWLAFVLAFRGCYIRAALLAGLAALTRNQGVLVAITLGLLALADVRLEKTARFKKFVVVAILTFGIYSLWLAFLGVRTGTIFASSMAQKQWNIAGSIGQYITNFFWLSPGQAPRTTLFWTVLGCGFWIVFKERRRGAWPIGIYLIASAMLWPLQAYNLPQAYRFGAVLFPFWFFLGNNLEMAIGRLQTVHQISIKAAVFVTLVSISATISSFYFTQSKTHWPY